MKKIISIMVYILFVTLSINCKSQIPQNGDNIVNNDINKFIGTWNWSSGNNSLQLIFKKENIHNPYLNINFTEDVLIGFHKFMSNGNIVENSTQFSNTNFSNENWTILAGTKPSYPNKLTGLIEHLSKNKSINFTIDYIDATHISLIKLQNTSGIKFRQPSDPPFDGSITLPQNIILTKQ